MNNRSMYFNCLSCLAITTFNTLALLPIKSRAELSQTDTNQSSNECFSQSGETDIDNSFKHYFQSSDYFEQGKLSEAIESRKIAIIFAPDYWFCELQRVRGPKEEEEGKRYYQRALNEYKAPNGNRKKGKEHLMSAFKRFESIQNTECKNEVKSILNNPSSSNFKLKNPSSSCLPSKSKASN
ncbi:MAG: hypothetical protein RM368_15515 [Nostoc sp. DedSLP03]|uniref:hypothetical protein n=1 Tax=Nostoc sp. DedSLP03 TaxID=3075400 RepID=UPI002AD352F7|nr:hypothetical protein [Nostoc sp. DedSLP03]MDZ7966361.1 hypothetical protein [Nostoc sp. DedSLP03]